MATSFNAFSITGAIDIRDSNVGVNLAFAIKSVRWNLSGIGDLMAGSGDANGNINEIFTGQNQDYLAGLLQTRTGNEINVSPHIAQ